MEIKVKAIETPRAVKSNGLFYWSQCANRDMSVIRGLAYVGRESEGKIMCSCGADKSVTPLQPPSQERTEEGDH